MVIKGSFRTCYQGDKMGKHRSKEQIEIDRQSKKAKVLEAWLNREIEEIVVVECECSKCIFNECCEYQCFNK